MYVSKCIEQFSAQPPFPGGVLGCSLQTNVQLSLEQSNNVRESTEKKKNKTKKQQTNKTLHSLVEIWLGID